MKYRTEIDALNGIAESLERIADTLDTIAMGQDAAQQTLEELADFILADEEPPVTAKGEYPLPGFDGDPLAKFPNIRKDETNGTSN